MQSKAAGLPNIVGLAGGVLLGVPYNFEGALYSSVSSNTPIDSYQGTTERGIKLDASKSNSIYGNSITVQPPALILIPQTKY